MFTIMFLVCIALLMLLMQVIPGISLVWYFDTISLLMILLVSIPMMVAAGVQKDFVHACAIVNRSKIMYTKEELEKAKIAVDLAGKLIMVSGVLSAGITFIAILVTLDDVQLLGPNVAVMMLSIVYALVLEMFILPMGAKLRKMIVEQAEREEL